MFHLINERLAQERAAELQRHTEDARRRAERAHRDEVERVRASLVLVPRTAPGAPREA